MGINRHKMLALMVARSLRNNARISAWTLATLTTCAALVTLFTTATFEVGNKLSHALRQLGANAVAYPVATDPAARWNEFTMATERLRIRTAALSVGVGIIQGRPVGIVTAEPQRLAELTPYWSVTGRRPQASAECLVGQRAATALGVKPGQEIEVNRTKLRVVGISNTGDEDEDRLFVTAPTASGAGYRYALLSAPGGEPQLEQLQRTLAREAAGIEVKPLRQILHGENRVLAKVNVLFVTTLAAVLALTALGVSASMLARVVERRKEFALLRAIGAKRRAVVAFVLAESATVGVAGALLGFVAGTALAGLVVRQIFQVTIGPQAWAFAAALATTTIVSLVAGGIACGRTLRFRPAAALRGE